MKRRVSAATRLLHDLFIQYPSTFLAFCELINNSIQAHSKLIDIHIDYAREDEIFPTAIKSLVVKDDGIGVHVNHVQEKLLDFGDSSKKEAKVLVGLRLYRLGRMLLLKVLHTTKWPIITPRLLYRSTSSILKV